MRKLILLAWMIFNLTPAITAQTITVTFTEKRDQVQAKVNATLGYGAFDWIQAEVKGNDVYLTGFAIRPFTKIDAGIAAKKLPFVKTVYNNVEILPLSMTDDETRLYLYTELYQIDSPLYLYGVGPNPQIHILVNHGVITLEGRVLKSADSDLAYLKARNAPNVVEVVNNLQVQITK